MSKIKFTRNVQKCDEKRIRAENGKLCHAIELKLKRNIKLSIISIVPRSLMESKSKYLWNFGGGSAL